MWAVDMLVGAEVGWWSLLTEVEAGAGCYWTKGWVA